MNVECLQNLDDDIFRDKPGLACGGGVLGGHSVSGCQLGKPRGDWFRGIGDGVIHGVEL
jgi:hypothetical protein